MSNNLKSKRIYAPEFKCIIMREHFINGISGPELRKKYGLKKSTFGTWRFDFLHAGFDRMHQRIKYIDLLNIINDLKCKNSALEIQLSHLQLRNNLLKESLKYGLEIRARKRYRAVEKLQIIKLVEKSNLSRPKACQEIGIDNSGYYGWLNIYQKEGYKGLCKKSYRRSEHWNAIPIEQKELVLNMHIQNPLMGATQLRWHIVDKCGVFLGRNIVKRLVSLVENNTAVDENLPHKAADSFPYKSSHIHQMWQTDFTKVRLANGRYYYVSVIIDDFSRYIIAHGIYKGPSLESVFQLFRSALAKIGNGCNHVDFKPRVFTDRGGCYTTPKFEEFLASHGMKRVVGIMNRPTTRGKVERFFLTMKRAIRKECIRSRIQLEQWLDNYIDFYNNERCHHALDYCRPVDVYNGNQSAIMQKRREIRLKSPRIRGEKLSIYPTDRERRSVTSSI